MFHEQIYHFVLDRWALVSWAAVWILLHTDAVDLVVLLSLHVYFSMLSLEKAANTSLILRQCLSHSLSLADSLSPFLFLSFCAVKGQTETGVHCQVIPVKCLLCRCNWCHPAVTIISDWECVRCCFLPFSPFNSQPLKEKLFILSSYP